MSAKMNHHETIYPHPPSKDEARRLHCDPILLRQSLMKEICQFNKCGYLTILREKSWDMLRCGTDRLLYIIVRPAVHIWRSGPMLVHPFLQKPFKGALAFLSLAGRIDFTLN